MPWASPMALRERMGLPILMTALISALSWSGEAAARVSEPGNVFQGQRTEGGSRNASIRVMSEPPPPKLPL